MVPLIPAPHPVFGIDLDAPRKQQTRRTVLSYTSRNKVWKPRCVVLPAVTTTVPIVLGAT